MKQSAQIIIAKCGGAERLARMLGVAPSTVHRWTYPKSRRGTGGLIPTQQQRALVIAARARGITLLPEDFFPEPGDEPEGEREAPPEGADAAERLDKPEGSGGEADQDQVGAP